MKCFDEKQYFIGSMSKSIERLPHWYQIGALCGVLIVIYLHDTFFISWLVMSLHNSLGTAWIWHPEYRTVLNHLSLKEHLCFTLYGIGLGIVVMLLYKVFCQERFKIGSSLSQLFPNRKGLTALFCVLLCFVEMIRMHEVTIECFKNETSIASIALKELVRNKSSNSKSKYGLHFVIQVELFEAYLLRVLPYQIMVTLVAIAYRLFRDIPRKLHVALRWYMVTIGLVYSAGSILSILFLRSKPTLSSLARIAWSTFILGTVNYLYGPSRRAGMVFTISSSRTVIQTIRGLLMCMALHSIISLFALALLVSVHVVELITIWFAVTLLMIWIPAIVDSCSLEGIVIVSGLLSILLYFMNELSSTTAFRLGIMVALWWLNTSLLYNLTVNAFHTRYVGLGVVVWWLLWSISLQKNINRTYGSDTCQAPAAINLSDLKSLVQSRGDEAVSAAMPIVDCIISRKIKWLCDVSELRVPLERPIIGINRFSESHKGSGTFYYIVFANLGLAVVLVSLLTLVEALQGPTVRSVLQQANLPLVTAGVLIRKIARATVLIFCVFSFLATWWLFYQYVLPYFTPILPSMVSHVISGVFGCITLGTLMDVKDTMYEGILQVFGLIDPEEYSVENSS